MWKLLLVTEKEYNHFCESCLCYNTDNACILFCTQISVTSSTAVVSVVKDRQHLRIDVVSVRNLCAMIVFNFSTAVAVVSVVKNRQHLRIDVFL